MPLRGRIAPTPTGFLHVGHARTFALAVERSRGAGLVLRIEDLDGPRCPPHFTDAAIDDLRWLGFEWTEGPDVGGVHAPYIQGERSAWFAEVWRRLESSGFIYPSPHSRRDVEEAATAPHDTDGEPVFPPSLRPTHRERASSPGGVAWRFRVPDGRTIEFHDAIQGTVCRTAGIDFGDFVIWRRDDLASYELAVIADDHAMAIEEVVRGADLLTSTARQLLLYEALGWMPPAWCHAPLVCDAAGRRLAKRTGGLAIRDLRAAGWPPGEVLKRPIGELTSS
jgi:glutamyl/glutaminyl-tRNA synthetase